MYDCETPTQLDGSIGEGFDEYLFYLLTQIYSRRNKDFAPALQQGGLSLAEWRALSVINRLDGCLMSELSEFTTVDRTTLTRTVDHLVSEEVVARNISASDRRQVMVTLTAKGRTIFEQAVDALKEHNRRALNGLSDDDLRTLRSLLQRVLMNIVSEPERFQQILKFER